MKNLKLFLLISLLSLAKNLIKAQHITVHSGEFLSSVADVHQISDNEYVLALKTLGLDFWTYGRLEWIKDGALIKEIDLPYYCRDLQFHEIDGQLLLDVDYFGECDVIGGFMETFLLDTLTQENMYPALRGLHEIYNGKYYGLKRYQDSLFAGIRVRDTDEFPDSIDLYNLEFDLIRRTPLTGINFRNLKVFEHHLITYNNNEISFLNGNDDVLTHTALSSEREIISTKLDSNYLYVLSKKNIDINNSQYEVNILNYEGEILDTIHIDIEDFNASELEYYHGTNIDTGLYIIGSYSSGEDGFFHYKQEEWIDHSEELNGNTKLFDLVNVDNDFLWITGNVKTSDENGDVSFQNLTIQEFGDKADEDLISLELHEVTHLDSDDVRTEIIYTITNLQDNVAEDINIYSLNVFDGLFCPGSRYDGKVTLNALESRLIRDTIVYYSRPQTSELVLFSSGSNRQLDGNLTNNISRKTITSSSTDLVKSANFIYPNPADKFINIDSKYIGRAYTLYFINGQKKLSGSIKENINIENLRPGIYIFSIALNDQNLISKFVKTE